MDPSNGACFGGDNPKNCQFGNLGRNALRGPNFVWSDFYFTKWFPLAERVKMRFNRGWSSEIVIAGCLRAHCGWLRREILRRTERTTLGCLFPDRVGVAEVLDFSAMFRLCSRH